MSNTRLGLIRCEHCGRQFNPHSGARHIPWCAKQQNEQKKHRLTADMKQALERYRWRINYRPSNQLNRTNNDRKSSSLSNNNNNNNLTNGKSINYSLSSPSAGSTTSSIGTNSLANSININEQKIKKNNRQQQQQQNKFFNNLTSQQNSNSIGQLKRSISSITLTKQKGVINNNNNNLSKNNLKNNYKDNSRFINSKNESEYSSSYNNKFSLMKQRAKSHNDLLGMNEIVETLSKRMDEIYAQNQILLAKISQNSTNNNINNTTTSNSDDEEEEEDQHQSMNNNDNNKCHHCKSICLKDANYCHKCGCKLAVKVSLSASSSPIT